MISSTSLPEPGLIRAACGEADIQTLNELISRIVENKSLSNEKLYELLLDADENKSTSLHAACHAILFKPMRNAPKDAKVDLYGQVNQESNGAVQCIELLLRNHVPVNIRNNVGITPVYISARDAQVKAIELLAKANADPNIPALNGISPLMYAASHDQKVATSTLLSLFSGTIQVNAVDSANRTALAMACRGYPECVKLLLDVGADPNIGDNTAVDSFNYFPNYTSRLLH